MVDEQDFDFIANLPGNKKGIAQLGGDIDEVLQQLSNLGITARRLIYWDDDGTNAFAIYSKLL